LVAGESLMMYVSRGFPWFDLHSGSGLAANLYAIQPASVFGIHVLSFITIVFNYLAAAFVAEKKYKMLYIPAAIFSGYMLCGLLLLASFERSNKVNKPFNLAIIAENIVPDIKWDDNNGNLLVNKLLQLNKSAATSKPGLILWSESAIPWTYRKDDDLVNEILKTTDPSGITHLLGINTEISGNQVYNSAYAILPGGEVAGRYDIQFLIALIEQPLIGFIMPFFSSKGFVAKNDTAHAAPLPTPFGKAGVFICNEAAVPETAANKCRQGANYLCNMSNDGWFNDTYIVNLHFYYDRLRSVESRKDLAVNCNNGYSGLIKASGEIEEMRRSEDPFVQLVTIEPNTRLTIASWQPRLFAYPCMLFIAFAFVYRRISESRNNKPGK
jgi:apolipoprotein N-acyltransferase